MLRSKFSELSLVNGDSTGVSVTELLDLGALIAKRRQQPVQVSEATLSEPGCATRTLVVDQTSDRPLTLEQSREEMRILDRVTNPAVVVGEVILPIGPVIRGGKTELELYLVDPFTTVSVDQLFDKWTATTWSGQIPDPGRVII